MSQGNAVGNLETILRTATGGESFDRSKLVLRSFFAENEQEPLVSSGGAVLCPT